MLSGVPYGFTLLGKLAASRNLACVLILFTVAPVKSFPVVVALTRRSIAEIVPRAFEKVRVGRGSCPFPY